MQSRIYNVARILFRVYVVRRNGMPQFQLDKIARFIGAA